MKVVIFCGGLGMRMRTETNPVPKPMAMVGSRPVLWHVMRYYAHFGHTEFILCLGYGAQAVKQYFLDYQEAHSNDFVLHDGGRRIVPLQSDIHDWRITFVDTGMGTEIGERLRRVRPYLEGDEMFLANYGDVLTDAPINDMIARVRTSGAAASLLAVKPNASFHVVRIGDDDRITGIQPVTDLALRENGGYFVLRQDVFDVLGENEDLVGDALGRLAEQGRLLAIPYDGFWAPMDTLKERQHLEDLHNRGRAPWEVWDGKIRSHLVAIPTQPTRVEQAS